MCCTNKKNRSPSKQNPKRQTSLPKQQSHSPIPPINPSKSPSSFPPSVHNHDQSRISITLQKSTFILNKISDPSTINLFKDCQSQKIQITKITNQHQCYVRHQDYLQITMSQIQELKELQRVTAVTAVAVPDCSMAKYRTYNDQDDDYGAGNLSLCTPNVNTFYYGQNVVDTGYHPGVEAYRKYQREFKYDDHVTNDDKDGERTHLTQEKDHTNKGAVSNGIRKTSRNNVKITPELC